MTTHCKQLWKLTSHLAALVFFLEESKLSHSASSQAHALRVSCLQIIVLFIAVLIDLLEMDNIEYGDVFEDAEEDGVEEMEMGG